MIRPIVFFALLSASVLLLGYGIDTSKGAWMLRRYFAWMAGGALLIAALAAGAWMSTS